MTGTTIEQRELTMTDTKKHAGLRSILTDALADFGPRFLDEDFCRRWLLDRIFRDGIKCPYCGYPVEGRQLYYYYRATRQNICAKCRRKFSTLKGSVFHSTKLSFADLVLVAFLAALGETSEEIAARIRRQPMAVQVALGKFHALDTAAARSRKEAREARKRALDMSDPGISDAGEDEARKQIAENQ